MTLSIYQQLYWLTRLDSIGKTFEGLLVFSVIGLIIMYIIYGMFKSLEDWDKEQKITYPKLRKKIEWILYPICIVTLIIHVLLPTRNDVLFIVAGGKTIEFVQKDTSINKIPGQATKIVTESLDLLEKKLKASDK